MLKKGFRLSCVLGLGALIVVLLPGATGVRAQYGIENGEWRTYGGDLGSTKYAPLDQINAENFNKLEVAWRFKTDMLGQRPDYNLETTPIVVRGVLYATAGSSRDVVAIDAATGELLWMYRYDEGKRAEASLRRLSGRGVGYWTDGREERIYVVTIGYQLVALDAKTGRPVTAFGTRGIVDLKQEDDQILDPITGGVAWNGAPVIAKNVVIVGAAHGGEEARRPLRATSAVLTLELVRGFGSSTRLPNPASSETRRGRATPGRIAVTPAYGHKSPLTKNSALPICRWSWPRTTITVGIDWATISLPSRLWP